VSPTPETLIEILAWLCLAFVCALLGGLRPLLARGALLPAPRHRAVPWTGWEVGFAILLPMLVPAFLYEFLKNSGLLDTVYGIDLRELLNRPTRDALRQQYAGRLEVWTVALALPLQTALVLIVFSLVSGTRPYQLGLTLHRGGANLVLGARAWLVVTPVVFVAYLITLILYTNLVDQPPDEHPITRLVQGPALPVDWVLMVLVSVAAAPLWEELFFRGILQPWLSRRSWGGYAAWGGALASALLSRSVSLVEALEQDDAGLLLHELSPTLFVLALAPGFLLVDRFALRLFPRARVRRVPADEPMPSGGPVGQDLGGFQLPSLTPRARHFWLQMRGPAGIDPRSTARAWYGTAILFAAAHSGVWPSPVPLLLLALALGWLAYRTQSLFSPIFVHATFNGVACLSLILLQFLPAPETPKGKKTTSAADRAPSASTSTIVPGSFPRLTYARAMPVPRAGDTTLEVTRPTSLPSRNSFAPAGTAPPLSFSPSSERLTWPRSRMRTSGSWPRKQPLV
jgi:membrane protease YdiL (CAAX protease family)